MDSKTKRMVLTVVICTAILIGYHFIADRGQQPAPQQTQVTQQNSATTPTEQIGQPVTTPAPTPATTETTPATSASSTAGQTYTPLVDAEQQSSMATSERAARKITVDTPLYTAVFSEKGASLRSFTLKRYARDIGGPLGLSLFDFKDEEPSTLSLSLTHLDPLINQRIFAANQEKIKIEENGQTISLEFSYEQAGVTIHRVYTFNAETYAIQHKIAITNQAGHQIETEPEITLLEPSLLGEDNIYTLTGLSALIDNGYNEYSSSDLEKTPLESGKVTWLALNVPYFTNLIAPESQPEMRRSIRGGIRSQLMSATLVEPRLSIPHGHRAELNYLLFFGPKDIDLLEAYGKNIAEVVNYGWFDAIAKPMLWLLKFIYQYISNYGVAIILVTLVVKLIFWPLTRTSFRSMKNMQRLQPQVRKLRDKYKNDRNLLNQETMKLYKANKVNPMGGCLPIVIQIPVFFAFYKVLGAAIELRHAPFMLWMNDLSAPDRLPLGGIEIPWVGAGLPVLTLLMGLSMFLQQKFMPQNADPVQQKIMLLMPILFTILFINFPSGLVLYWLFNNIFSIIQQYFTLRQK